MKTTIAATAAVKLEIYIKLQIFKILSIVVHSFSKDTQRFYSAPIRFGQFIHSKNKTELYSHQLYADIIAFNQARFPAAMIASIFGRKLDGTGKRINYKEVFDKAIDQGRLVKFNQGSLVIKGIRYHYPTGYLVPFETIDAIVQNPLLLREASNAMSQFYTRRERQLIFRHILKQKMPKRQKANSELTDTELDELVKDVP